VIGEARSICTRVSLSIDGRWSVTALSKRLQWQIVPHPRMATGWSLSRRDIKCYYTALERTLTPTFQNFRRCTSCLSLLSIPFIIFLPSFFFLFLPLRSCIPTSSSRSHGCVAGERLSSPADPSGARLPHDFGLKKCFWWEQFQCSSLSNYTSA